MKPLILLIIVTSISLLVLKIITGKFDYVLSARIGMSAMLIFTAIGHFIFTDGMALMIPEFIPFKKEIVYLTGIIEILAAIGIHFSLIRPTTGYFLILFLVLLLPSNIKASLEQLNYQNATYDGNGLLYLWFRIPLQILFIVWIYITTLRFR